jgi:hypothetical protein
MMLASFSFSCQLLYLDNPFFLPSLWSVPWKIEAKTTVFGSDIFCDTRVTQDATTTTKKERENIEKNYAKILHLMIITIMISLFFLSVSKQVKGIDLSNARRRARD